MKRFCEGNQTKVSHDNDDGEIGDDDIEDGSDGEKQLLLFSMSNFKKVKIRPRVID